MFEFLNILSNGAALSHLSIINEDFFAALKMMGVGMGGIFVSLSIIALASIGLQKLFPVEEEKEGGNDE